MAETSPNPGSASPRALVESDRVEGTAVYGADGAHLGTVKRLIIEKLSGRVVYAVVSSSGGLFGAGADLHTLPWGKLHYDKGLRGFRTDIVSSQLHGAPTLTAEELHDTDREAELHAYYDIPPYWRAL